MQTELYDMNYKVKVCLRSKLLSWYSWNKLMWYIIEMTEQKLGLVSVMDECCVTFLCRTRYNLLKCYENVYLLVSLYHNSLLQYFRSAYTVHISDWKIHFSFWHISNITVSNLSQQIKLTFIVTAHALYPWVQSRLHSKAA